MKVLYIPTFIFMILLQGCATLQNTTSVGNMQLINATYKHWSHPPSASSDIPERGTDLTITVRNWPEKYTPQYIVYNKWRSSSAQISQKSDSTMLITARIIRMSAMLQKKKSETVDLTDRLVFKDDDGNTQFIEIDSWHPSKE